MKIVIDTNVLMSGIFFGGKPAQLLYEVLDDTLQAIASTSIIEEYIETAAFLDVKTARTRGVDLTGFINHLEFVEPTCSVIVCRDPDDDKFLECAKQANCHYIVSGDKDLLSLGQYEISR